LLERHAPPSGSQEGDWALLLLDRRVKGREGIPADWAMDAVRKGDELAMIGHPMGLPTKVTSGAQVLGLSSSSVFTSKINIFHGDSGAPVLNLRSKRVVGIAAKVLDSRRIYKDFEKKDACFISKVYSEGEPEISITRLSAVASDLRRAASPGKARIAMPRDIQDLLKSLPWSNDGAKK
jgi:S1-C subfamily serine protease